MSRERPQHCSTVSIHFVQSNISSQSYTLMKQSAHSRTWLRSRALAQRNLWIQQKTSQAREMIMRTMKEMETNTTDVLLTYFCRLRVPMVMCNVITMCCSSKATISRPLGSGIMMATTLPVPAHTQHSTTRLDVQKTIRGGSCQLKPKSPDIVHLSSLNSTITH